MNLRELPPKPTPLTYASITNALILALDSMGVPLSRAVVRLAVAQIAIESGLTSCQNFNISGIKAKPNNGRTCWQYFTTTERFTPAQVAAAEHFGPGLVEVINQDDHGKVKVRIKPKHPYCCFRAFESLDEAMRDHLETLRKTFPHGWTGLLTGDADQFAHGLKVDGYYTALEDDYERGLLWRIKQEMASVTDANIVWGDIQ